jgi:D-alanine-D-alanine ligase
MSARSVLGALDPAKYAVTQIGITHDGEWLVGDSTLEAMLSGDKTQGWGALTPAALLPDPTRQTLYAIQESAEEVRTEAGSDHVSRSHDSRLEPLTGLDVVFPVLHGTFGEDGALQGLLEMSGMAYVGAGVLGSALGMDKGVFKDILRAHHIPVIESIVVLRSEIEKDMGSVLGMAEGLAGYPLFVKPANLGSSVGITKCTSRSDLMEGLLEAARYDRRVLVERGVNGREIEVSILGNEDPQASTPGEILPSREFYSYEAKYLDDSSGLLIPAPLSAELTAQVQALAIQAYRAIDCAGMARVDFLLDKDTQELYLSEVNTIPGFTEISMYPKLWEASGLPYPALLDRLIELALARKAERDRTVRRYRRDD